MSIGRSAGLPNMLVETAVVGAVWTALAVLAPLFFIGVYLPGYALGIGLCWLQGHFEHVGGTTSHYGRLYNWFFFNDGYHVEHHLRPGEHWSRLPRRPHAGARTSRWPPVLRWLIGGSSASSGSSGGCCDRRGCNGSSSRARTRIPRAAAAVPPPHRVTIVGGGLFPRRALVLRRLLPDATLTIVDAQPPTWKPRVGFLDGSRCGTAVRCRHGRRRRSRGHSAVFIGDRERVYDHPPAPAIFVHDWIWRRAAEACRVVAAAQAAESRRALRAACLFAVLVAAKAITLVGTGVPVSAWALAAYIWQDVLLSWSSSSWSIASLKRDRIGWALYLATVVYAAINVPVTRVLSTPLTWTICGRRADRSLIRSRTTSHHQSGRHSRCR